MIFYKNYITDRKYVVWLLTILLSCQLSAQPEIKGQLFLDTTWAPIVYLSLIPDLNNLYSMSNNMIIEKTGLDKDGKFSINIDYIPKEDQLYRIHLSKKGDPPASLIIGGRDENHLFFVANNKCFITIKNNPTTAIISDADILGYCPNQTLQEINKLVLYVDTADFNGSSIKRELMSAAMSQKLKQIADTCSHPIVALYALYKSKYEYDILENPQYYQRFINKWESDKANYFNEFRKTIPISKNQQSGKNFLFVFGGFLLGALFTFFIFIKKKKGNLLLKKLTTQERKILIFLQNGKSNKEISEELNIEISTVKSHVNSIYSKLKIKSRKDVLNMSEKIG